MRGLSDVEVARNGYASLPDPQAARRLCAGLSSRFDLSGVPGFSRFSDAWLLRVGDWHRGFFVPVRDAQGRIQAMQIRRDDGEPRYCWFSSTGKPKGASSGAPVHFARPWRAASTGEAIITEGALKADIIAEHLDACVVAVAGVCAFRDDFGRWLRGQLPALGETVIAFDADWRTKPEVERAMIRLARSLDASGLRWDVASWDASLGKGLDDALTGEVARCK
jgi:DNA primase